MPEHRMEAGNPPFDEVLGTYKMEDELRVTGHSPQSDVNEDYPLSHGWVPSHQQYSKGLHPLGDPIGLSDDSRSSSDLTEMKTASPATALAAVTYETGSHSLTSHSPQAYHHTGIINSPIAIHPACSPVPPLGCNDNNSNAPVDCQTMYYSSYDNAPTSVCPQNQPYEYPYYITGTGFYQGSPDSSTGSYPDNSPPGYDSEDSELPNMATTCMQSPHPHIYSQFNTGSLVYNNIPCMDKLDSDKSPNKRGRPCTFLKRSHQKHAALSKMSYMDSTPDDDLGGSYNQNQRCKRGAKNILLWKFLLEELRNSGVRSAHIKWENEQEGTFKFVDTTECSRRWGQMKKKADMNFEKLSRGIRHYYRDGLMSRKDGIRLVYKFNWEHVPLKYRPTGQVRYM
ncbi:transcription factor ets-4-like isoform X2 [Dreissena polymorpha]|uniref:transcription factor ets-4-like isoform X2 n=1 Tax=Dreissena polymorpha TaxID=45954 RepID=UPI002264FEAC|nr:transcription factor ets-4-like isoform X2 [Dreissena polymorpha]